jgi:hypothetical protein
MCMRMMHSSANMPLVLFLQMEQRRDRSDTACQAVPFTCTTSTQSSVSSMPLGHQSASLAESRQSGDDPLVDLKPSSTYKAPCEQQDEPLEKPTTGFVEKV